MTDKIEMIIELTIYICPNNQLLVIYKKPNFRARKPIFLDHKQVYEEDSICNEIALITPPTHGLELYSIYGMKVQGFTFRMVHQTLFYHSYLSSYRR